MNRLIIGCNGNKVSQQNRKTGIKKDCEELAFYGLIKIEEKIHPANGRKSYEITLTEKGKQFISEWTSASNKLTY